MFTYTSRQEFYLIILGVLKFLILKFLILKSLKSFQMNQRLIPEFPDFRDLSEISEAGSKRPSPSREA